MTVKKEYIILVLIIIALALYLSFRRADVTHYTLPELPDVNRQDISKIEITRAGETILLERKDGGWILTPMGYPADMVKVETMIEVLDKLTLSALVSESRSYERYDLSDKKRLSIKAWEGETLMRDFWAGKVAPSSRHTFVALAGDDRVFHAMDNLRNTFDRSLDDLRDKQVLSFTPSDINEIRIVDEDRTFDLSRSMADDVPEPDPVKGDTEATAKKAGASWRTPDGEIADKPKVDRLLGTLSSLECQRYLDESIMAELTDPFCIISLKGPDTISLSLFPKTGEEDTFFPSRSSMSPYPFELSERNATEFMSFPDDVLEKTDGDAL
jgi:hypothetical protein